MRQKRILSVTQKSALFSNILSQGDRRKENGSAAQQIDSWYIRQTRSQERRRGKDTREQYPHMTID